MASLQHRPADEKSSLETILRFVSPPLLMGLGIIEKKKSYFE